MPNRYMRTYAHLVQRNRPRLNNCLDCLKVVLFSLFNVDSRDCQVDDFLVNIIKVGVFLSLPRK